MKQKRIRIKRTKLGRQKVWGLADELPILIDERLKGKKELEIIIHECLHYLFPEKDEPEIEKKSILLTNTLWYEHYRKIDNNSDEPMQDGTS